MKYNIFGFSQEKVLSLSRVIVDKNGKEKDISLDISDLMILQVMGDFMNRSKIIKYTINDKTYFNVQYKIILQDLPILKIKQQALTDRLNKMVELEVLEKEIVRNQSGSYSVFRIGEKYEELKYDKGLSKIDPHPKLYKEQLKDRRWKKLANKIRKRDKYTCQMCGNHKTLQVHHKHYIKGKLAWEYDDSNFITLCRDCHKEIHNIK